MSGNQQILCFIAVVAIFALYSPGVVAIKCYQCQSIEAGDNPANQDCIDGKDLTLQDCDIFPVPITKCYKISATVTVTAELLGNKEVTKGNVLERGCNPNGAITVDECSSNVPNITIPGMPQQGAPSVGPKIETKVKGTACYCSEDMCNHAAVLESIHLLLFLSVISAFLINTFSK